MWGRFVWLAWIAACRFQQGAIVDDGPIDVAYDIPFDAVAPFAPCAPLPVGGGTVTSVSSIAALRGALATATAGEIIELADGTYDTSAGALNVNVDGVTLRSLSGDPTRVILDAKRASNPVIALQASNVVITALTIANSNGFGVAIAPPVNAVNNLTGDQIYGVSFSDNDGAAIHVTAALGDMVAGPWADGGTIACSQFSDAPGSSNQCSSGVLGIAADGIRGWVIRDNRFDGVICDTALRRAVWIRAGSRDVQLLRNVLVGSNMNLTLGDGALSLPGPPARTFPDPAPGGCASVPQFWGGLVCDNAIDGLNVPQFMGNGSFDDGIALWTACDTWVMHNTVVSPAGNQTFTDLEYRFAGTFVHDVNNLVEKIPVGRDSGAQDAMYTPSNLVYGSVSDFVDTSSGDLHLKVAGQPGAAINGLDLCTTDGDGKPRVLAAPTVGAYEH